MWFFRKKKQKSSLKIVYYGPGLSGKTSNIKYIHDRLHKTHRSDIINVSGEMERSLSFDFSPASLEGLSHVSYRLCLYTVPGPVFYDNSRVLILKGVDGVVFVADSQAAREESNIEFFEQLESNLSLNGDALKNVPLVLQYNKRDLPELLSVAELDATLNAAGRPRFEAIASRGVGVMETLQALVALVLEKNKSR